MPVRTASILSMRKGWYLFSRARWCRTSSQKTLSIYNSTVRRYVFSDPIGRNKLLISKHFQNRQQKQAFPGRQDAKYQRHNTPSVAVGGPVASSSSLQQVWWLQPRALNWFLWQLPLLPPFADWLSFSRLSEVEQQCNESYQLVGKSSLSASSFFPFSFLIRKAQRDELIFFLLLGVMNTWL